MHKQYNLSASKYVNFIGNYYRSALRMLAFRQQSTEYGRQSNIAAAA